jgi:hypothetical protein
VARACPQFADLTWSKADKHIKSRNIMAAIDQGNVLYKLVASEILRFVTVEDRAKAIDWFIRVRSCSRYMPDHQPFSSSDKCSVNSALFERTSSILEKLSDLAFG